MNFLAHAFLSGNDKEMIIGGFIADHVKGGDKMKFSDKIIRGIEHHRSIDTFTDSHPETEKSKQRLRPRFHKYSPVIVDVFYDHFLAKHWSMYSQQSLSAFVQQFYSLMEKNTDLLPLRTQRMLRFMTEENWLESYAEVAGIHISLSNMARRTRFNSGMEEAAAFLQKHYAGFEQEFLSFFPDLKKFSDKIRN